MGGGGGNTTTTTSGVPDWLKPDVQRAFREASDAHGRGALSGVAGVDDAGNVTHEQARALDAQEKLALDAFGGKGIYDNTAAVNRDLANVAGQNLAGRAGSGTLTSARGDRAQAAALADRSLQHQQAQQQNAALGTQALLSAADKRDAKQQLALDSDHQGLQRLFGYFGSGAAGQKSEASGGGGK